MNVNCPEFIPSARREVTNRVQASKQKFVNRRSVGGNSHDPNQVQQQHQHLQRRYQHASAQWSLAQIFMWTPAATAMWRVLDGYEYDTVQQRFGSNGSHQQEQQDIVGPGKMEGGSSGVNGNQFTINHGQKSGHGKSSTSSPKGRNSGGISKQRHNDNKTHPAHPWLVTTLKGHTDEIRDIGFSSSGKFLATCAEENLINSKDNSCTIDDNNLPTTLSSNNTNNLSAAVNDDDLNTTPSSNKTNEDLATAYQIKEKIKKSATKSGRNRRQKKVNQPSQNQRQAASNLFSTHQMDIDEEGKENQQPSTPKAFRKQNKSAVSPLMNTVNSNKGSNQEKSTLINMDNLTKISRAVTPPLRQHTKLNLQEPELVKYLRHYIIDPAQLRMYGYPVESEIHTGLAELYKHPPRVFGNMKLITSLLGEKDALGKRDSGTWEDNNSDVIPLSGDSGRGSDSSSPPSVDSDASENGEDEVAISTTLHSTDAGILQQFLYSSLERSCARCKSSFYVTDNGDYLTQEECTYHWGKTMQVYKPGHGFCTQYTCCDQDTSTDGCTKNRLHVWSGVSVGINGPYDDYVQTQSPQEESVADSQAKVYAMDCEMCFTGLGLEVAKVTVVGADGQLVYEQFVRPESEVVDYNTRFSGITEKDLLTKNCNVKSLREIQQDLLQLFNSETILIGHALENDLRVLRILHKNIIDTSIAFPHVSGFPFRRSLKNLTKAYLKRDIQVCESGHSSFEDSRACLELMLWRVRRDFRTILEQ